MFRCFSFFLCSLLTTQSSFPADNPPKLDLQALPINPLVAPVGQNPPTGTQNNYLCHCTLALKTVNGHNLRGAAADVELEIIKLKKDNNQQWVVDTDFNILKFMMDTGTSYNMPADRLVVNTKTERVPGMPGGKAFDGLDVGEYNFIVKAPVRKNNANSNTVYELQFTVPLLPAKNEEEIETLGGD